MPVVICNSTSLPWSFISLHGWSGEMKDARNEVVCDWRLSSAVYKLKYCYLQMLLMLFSKCGLKRVNLIIAFWRYLSSSEKALRNSWKKKSWLTIIYLYIYGLMIDPHNDQRPLGLIAQLVKNQTRIAEVRVRNFRSELNFSGFSRCFFNSVKMRCSNSFRG